MKAFLLVGLGGALGSMLRYAASRLAANHIERYAALWGTFAVNLLGSLLIGIVFGLSERYQWLTPQLRLLLAGGFCGGFTTFSAFAFENVTLWQSGQYGLSLLYMLASVTVCTGAAFLGFVLVK